MKLSNLKNKMFDGDIHIRKRLFVLSILITIVALLISLIELALTDNSITNVVMLGGGLFIVILLAWYSIKHDHYRAASMMAAIFMGYVHFPLCFFWGGGINGDAPLWCLFSVLFMSLILSGKIKVILLVGEAILAIVCYYLSYTHPEYIVQNTNLQAHQYSLIALLSTSVAISLMIELEIRLYIRESIQAEKQRMEIELLNASQNQFFSSMSHEIRTPINTIIGLNEMILREDISDEVAEDAANIRSASKLLPGYVQV